MKILFINISDTGYNLGNKSSQSLKKKYKQNADHVKLLELGTAAYEVLVKKTTTFENQSELSKAKNAIKQFKPDQIMLGVHGNLDNTIFCFHHDENGSHPLADAKTLAEFFYNLTDDTCSKLSLVMCYGARSDDYLKDHSQNNIKFDHSFAFKFLKHLKKSFKNSSH